MKRTIVSDWLLNLRSAKSLWGELPLEARRSLKKLTERFAISIAAGDLQFLEMLGTDKSRGYCLEMICADFLAGANLQEDRT